MLKKLILFSLVFLLSLQVITDTDFGWHMRTGEYILEHKQVPKTDIFSFTMPDYPYVFHSWAAEVLIYTSYQTLGFIGSSIFFAAMLTTCIFILYQITKLLQRGEPSFLFFLWLTPLTHAIAGSRTRIFGLLFLSLVYFLYLKFKIHRSKAIYLMSIVFLLWVNFHGSFMLGIFAFFLLLVTEVINKNSQIKTLTITFVISVIATLANPYFLNAHYQAIIIPINSYKLKTVNIDWQPLVNFDNSGWIMAALMLGFLAAALIFKIKIPTHLKNLFLVSFALSLFLGRFVLLLVVFFAPLASITVSHFKQKIKKGTFNALPVKFALVSTTVVLPLLILKNLLELNYAYESPHNYSEFLRQRSLGQAKNISFNYQKSQILKDNLKGKKVLAEANWGSFMLINDKNLNLFYYGAMDNFFLEGESFAYTYLKVVNAQDGYQDELKKYGVEVVFLPSIYPLVPALTKDPGWETVYMDGSATILKRILPFPS